MNLGEMVKRAQAAKARADKATKEPWHDTRYHDDDFGPWVETTDEDAVAHCSTDVVEHAAIGPFIARARTDVPALADDVIALVQRVRDLEKQLADKDKFDYNGFAGVFGA